VESLGRTADTAEQGVGQPSVLLHHVDEEGGYVDDGDGQRERVVVARHDTAHFHGICTR